MKKKSQLRDVVRGSILMCFMLVLSSTTGQAQKKELWGVNGHGGEGGAGTIFSTDSNGNHLEVRHHFQLDYARVYGHIGQLVEDSNGMFYGLSQSKIQPDVSFLYQYNRSTGKVKVLQEFADTTGVYCGVRLTGGKNGLYYSWCENGGTYGDGTLIEVDVYRKSVTKIADFNKTLFAGRPVTLVLSKNGNLYGATYEGGNGDGVFFEFNMKTRSFGKIQDLGRLVGYKPSSNIIEPDTGVFYGTCYRGGSFFKGVLYRVDISKWKYEKVFDFDEYPKANICLSSGGNIYGYTSGGANGYGRIYEYNLSTNGFSVKFDFDINTTGYNQYGSLLEFKKDQFIGACYQGGAHGVGVLFEFIPSKNDVKVLKDFKSGNNGRYPSGNHFLASNGRLYALTGSGGIDNEGVLYEYNVSSKKYTKLWDIGHASKGKVPSGTLFMADDQLLYGLASGGEYGDGVLYSFDPSKNIYTKLADFDDEGAKTGTYPLGTLVQAGSKGNLYGFCYRGGAYDGGVLFMYNRTTGKLSRKVNFDGPDYGAIPSGNLLLARNGLLYGTTNGGGKKFDGTESRDGVLFQFNPKTNTYKKLHDFLEGIDGSGPQGNLVEGDSGKIYGTIRSIDNKDYGGIFEYNPLTKDVKMVARFEKNLFGQTRSYGVMRATNGLIYGMRRVSGSHNGGLLYSFNPKTKELKVVEDIGPDSLGRLPLGYPMQGANGKLYGLTAGGGAEDVGSLFEYDILNDTLIYKHAFDLRHDGGIPGETSLIEIEVCRASCDTIRVEQCTPYRSPSARYLYSSSGRYSDTLTNVQGCDSIITIDLEIRTLDASVSKGDSLLKADSAGLNYQWFLCDSSAGYIKLDSATNQVYKPTKSGKYAVVVSWSSCSDTSECTQVILLNTNALNAPQIEVYPNPVSGRLNLVTNQSFENSEIYLYNSLGRAILTHKNTSGKMLSFDLSSYASGLYLLIVENGAGRFYANVLLE